jgi:hypothetical protein
LLEDRAQEAEKAAREHISEPPGEEVVVAAPPSIAS